MYIYEKLLQWTYKKHQYLINSNFNIFKNLYFHYFNIFLKFLKLFTITSYNSLQYLFDNP